MTRKSDPDEEGNFFEVTNNNGWLTVCLKLAKEPRSREIGKVNLIQETLVIKRSKAKHLFRKNNSYGFNEYFIRTAKSFKKVQLEDEDGTYLFPKSLVLERGSYLHFKGMGFERQLFLPLSEIVKHKTQDLF